MPVSDGRRVSTNVFHFLVRGIGAEEHWMLRSVVGNLEKRLTGALKLYPQGHGVTRLNLITHTQGFASHDPGPLICSHRLL